MESFRILMQLVVNFDLLLHQMDVKSPYLDAPLNCDINICQTPGFEELDKNGNKLVRKLKSYCHYKTIKLCHMRHRLRIFLFHRKVLFHSQDIQVFIFLTIP